MPHRVDQSTLLRPSTTAATPATPAPLALTAIPLETMVEVNRALEIARESPDGPPAAEWQLLDDTVNLLWKKIQCCPAYVMTRDEFSLFNYYQHRFNNIELAVQARALFWNSYRA